MILADRLGRGVDMGVWYFWNTDEDHNGSGRSFNRRQRAAHAGQRPHGHDPQAALRTLPAGQQGLAYTRAIHGHEWRSCVEQDTHGLHGITAILRIGLYGRPAA